MDPSGIARKIVTGISLAAAAQGIALASPPGWHTFFADFSEEVDHGQYQSCSLDINLSFHDATCLFDKQAVAPQTSGLRVKVLFTWSKQLRATVSVVGDSICHVKPEGLTFSSWSLRSGNVDPSKSWIVESASPVVDDEGVAALIEGSEASGMLVQAVRADNSILQFDVSPEEGGQEKALWGAQKLSHTDCMRKLKLGKAP